GERENFAGARIEHNHRARLRLVRLDRGLDLAKSEILQAAVDRQCEVSALLRRSYARYVLDDLAAAIDDHASAAGLTAQARLLRELHPLLSHIPVAGKPDDVAHDFAAGVIAPVFVLVVHALDVQRRCPTGNLP